MSWFDCTAKHDLFSLICFSTKESIVARVVVRGAFAVWLLFEPRVVVPDISRLSRSRSLYILFLTRIYCKCKLAQCVGFLYLKAGGLEFNLRWERDLANFFLSFFFLRRVIYLFFHKDAYKCFPFIIFLNTNAPIIIRKPTLLLCSFHNNFDNKCFVGYFWKLKKEKCSHTTRPWHSWNLSHYYFTVSYLSNHSTTFFSSFSQVAHWSAEIQTKVYDPRKEGRIA